MKISKRIVPALFTLLMSVSLLQAQEMHRHDPAEKLGQVNFPVSCSAAAQKQFNRALALQHSFNTRKRKKRSQKSAQLILRVPCATGALR